MGIDISNSGGMNAAVATSVAAVQAQQQQQANLQMQMQNNTFGVSSAGGGFGGGTNVLTPSNVPGIAGAGMGTALANSPQQHHQVSLLSKY